MRRAKWKIPGFRWSRQEVCPARERRGDKTLVSRLQVPGKILTRYATAAIAVLSLALLPGCTQETQNKLGRAIQNWTGTNGVLEIYAGEKLVKRFVEIDKISTADATQGGGSRPYRFGYGVMDENFNGLKDPNEKKVYFEFSDYSTAYVFFENPR